MWRVNVLAMAVVAACYAPNPQPGSPCETHAQCPVPLVCHPETMTCERRDRIGGVVDAPRADAMADAKIDAVQIDGCSPTFEICGDGIDQDCDDMDPACATNDVAGGAIDVTAGGTFMGDALLAKDDVAPNGCAGTGGRDLFFRVTLTAPEVFYFDTFGSSYDSVIRVYAKPCAMVGTGGGATACQNDACGGNDGQVAVNLPAGQSCIVIDQAGNDQMDGNLVLHVVRGTRAGMPLPSGMATTMGDTCSATNQEEPIDMNCDGPGAGGKDHAYFFTTCPGQTLKLDADLCPAPAWDPVLYVKRVNGNQIGCNDDTCGYGPTITNVAANGSTLYFLFVDGFDPGHCGPYMLDTNLRP